MPSSFFFVLPQIVLGIPIGALVVVLQFLSIRKWPIGKMIRRVLGVGIVCSVGLVALGLLQALIVRQGPDTNFLVGLLLEPLVVVLFVALAAVLVPFGIAGGFWLLQVRHLELPGAYGSHSRSWAALWPRLATSCPGFTCRGSTSTTSLSRLMLKLASILMPNYHDRLSGR